MFSEELLLNRPSIQREVLLDYRAEEPPWPRTFDASRGPVAELDLEVTKEKN